MSWIRQDGDDGRGWIFCAEKEFLQVALARAYLNCKFLYIENEFLIIYIHQNVQSRASDVRLKFDAYSLKRLD